MLHFLISYCLANFLPISVHASPAVKVVNVHVDAPHDFYSSFCASFSISISISMACGPAMFQPMTGGVYGH